MNSNATNTGMNIEDYEDQAVKRSKLAKGLTIGAGAAGVAAAAAGTTYAATREVEDPLDGPINAEEMAEGAEVGNEVEPISEPAPQPTTQYVYVEKPAPEPEPEPEPEITWDETTNYYVDGEKVMSVEEGTIEGHKFMLVDKDGDEHADLLAIDVNNNGRYEEDEIIGYTPADHVHMGHETAHTTDEHYAMLDPWEGNTQEESGHQYAYEENNHRPIHNNFEDEKTGEEYYGDFAEGNPDYNPNADVDYGNDQYLAENYGYDENDNENYSASIAEADFDEPSVEPQYDMADNDGMESDSYDSMMDNEEFLG